MRKTTSIILSFTLIFSSFLCVPAVTAKASGAVTTTTITPANEEESALLADLMQQYTTFVMVRHKQLGGSHYAYTESLSDTLENGSPNTEEVLFNPGSQLVLIELEKSGASVKVTETVLIDSPDGVLRDPDVSEDGTTVLFSWKKSKLQDDFHLYEYDLITDTYRQLTTGLGVADTEPKYLPNGNIIFSSTRMTQTIDCHLTPVSNLHICGPDGEDIVRVGYDQVHTTYPTVTDDGRVLYTRWDYNDRTQVFVQGVFQMFPDGTNQTEVFGNNSNFPTSLIHTREVKGTTDKYISVATGHHVKQAGKLVYVDTSLGRNDKDAVTFIFPDEYSHKEDYVDKYGQQGELYKYPYSISETQFLVSYAPNGWSSGVYDTQFGIYLMDTSGTQIELLSGANIPASQIVPVAERTLFERASMVNYGIDTGTFYIGNIYEGDGLKDVAFGTAKYLRVVALDYRAYAIGKTGQGGAGKDNTGNPFTPVSTGNGSWDTKRVLGIVPIEADGSVLFKVPSETPVYFQVLDKDGQLIQSMRSWSTLMPGETFSCVGCHEDKNTVPPAASTTSLAMQKGVQELQKDLWMTDEEYDPYEDSEGFDYLEEIQPILDESCVECHSDIAYSLQETHSSADDISADSPVKYEEPAAETASVSQTATTSTNTTEAVKYIINEDFEDFTLDYSAVVNNNTLNTTSNGVYWRVYSPNAVPTASNIVVPYYYTGDNNERIGPSLRTKTYAFNCVYAAAEVEAGKTYTFSVDLNGRGASDTVGLQIRTAKVSGDSFTWADTYKVYADKNVNTFAVPATYNFATYTYTFTPDESGLVAISLDNNGKSLLIDNFKLTTPDPDAEVDDGVIFNEDFSDFNLTDQYHIAADGTQWKLHLNSNTSISANFYLDSGWDGGANTVLIGKSWHQPIDILNVDVKGGQTYTFSYDWAPNTTNGGQGATAIQIRAMNKTSSPDEWNGWVSPDVYYATYAKNNFTGSGSELRNASYTFTPTADCTLCIRIVCYQDGGYSGSYVGYDNIKLIKGVPQTDDEPEETEDKITFIPVRSQGWRYVFDYTAGVTLPTDDSWTKADFDDSTWKTGAGGFGASKNGTGYSWVTWWSNGDGVSTKAWLRKTFTVTAEQLAELDNLSLYLDISYSRTPTVYINGELAYTNNHFMSGYDRVRISNRVKELLVEGTNVIAVSAAANGWGNFIDVGLVANTSPESQFSLQNVLVNSQSMIKFYPLSYLYLTNSINNADSFWFQGRSSNYYTNWIDSMSSAEMLEPYSCGSSKSYLIKLLRSGHGNLEESEIQAFQAWIDLGVPCYGEYDTNNNWNDNEQRWADESQNKRDYYDNLNNAARESRAQGGNVDCGIEIAYTSGNTVYNNAYSFAGGKRLDVSKAYASGDKVTVTLPEGEKYFALCLNSRVGESIIYAPSGTYTFTLPTNLDGYNKVFTRNTINTITARIPSADELSEHRNLAFNPYDDTYGTNSVSGYPHGTGTSHSASSGQFTVRNALDGVTANLNHGKYPVHSWGAQSSALGVAQWMQIDFGREVTVDEVVLYLRADWSGNHDTYYKSVKLQFSDGSSVTVNPQKVEKGQSFSFPAVKTTYVKLTDLVTANTSINWAGISEVEIYGYDTIESCEHTAARVAANAASCETDGNYEYYECSRCGSVFADAACTKPLVKADQAISASGHSHDFEGYCLQLDGKIGIGFNSAICDELLANANAAVRFTVGEDELIVNLSEAVRTADGNYNVYCPLTSVQLTEKVTAQMLDGNGNAVGEAVEVTAKQYADKLLSSDDYETAHDLTTAMLNFAGYAQQYFGNQNELANSTLENSAELIANVTVDEANNFTKSGEAEGVSFYGYDLVLNDRTDLRLYFKVDEGVNVSFMLDGVAVEAKDYIYNYKYITVKNIAAHELTKRFTVTVEDSTLSVSASALSYANSILKGSHYDDGLKNVVKALYNYSSAASLYNK